MQQATDRRGSRSSARNPSSAALGYRALVVPESLFGGEEPATLVTEELADLPVFCDLVS